MNTRFLTPGLVMAIALVVGPAAGEDAWPRTYKDAKGHTVTLPGKPARIASLTLGTDENLLDLVAPERLVAMTSIAKEPYVSNVAGRVPEAACLVTKELQAVKDLRPDLVLVATYTKELTEPLVAAGLPVYQFSEFHGLETLLRNLEILGQLTGEEAKADALLQECRARLARAAEKAKSRAGAEKPVRAIYYSEGRLAGAGTTPSDVLCAAGAVDACADFGISGTVEATSRLIANLHPDVIFIGEDTAEAEAATRALFASTPYQEIPAAKDGRVLAIPGKHITTVSYHIVEAVEDVQRLLGW